MTPEAGQHREAAPHREGPGHLGIGATASAQQSSLPDTKLLEALGNGFSCNVLEAIFKNLLLARI